MIFYRGFLLVFFCVMCSCVFAQIPDDLSRVKASQISDNQLQQILNQGKSSGRTPAEIEAELLRRGLPAAEMEELKLRIQQLDTSTGGSVDTTGTNFQPNGKRMVRRNANQSNEWLENSKPRSRIFGSELFSNTNLTFEPDLRMPTPKNYTIGPDDELLLNIYGVNISQQNLKVSPEGNVNVKYAGIINVNGLTVDAASAILKMRLTRYYPGLGSGQTKMQLTLGNIRSIRVVLIGAIKRPGTYTLPSLATLFNALYVSGGPGENGSFRKIELIRNNKVVEVADLYEFLIKGNQRTNVRLEDNDVIRVPFASLLVTLNGELNRNGIFELQKEETLSNALEYAGGFKSKAFRGRITGTRIDDFERSIVDVPGDSLAFFKPQNGDEYWIDSVINSDLKMVIINAVVFKH